MADRTTLTLDLYPEELAAVTMLANMGHCLLAGDRDALSVLGEMLLALPEAEATALTALQKLEAALKLASGMLPPSEGDTAPASGIILS